MARSPDYLRLATNATRTLAEAAFDGIREAVLVVDVRAKHLPVVLANRAARACLMPADAAGLVDHMHLVQVPIVLGRGVRVWDGLEALHEDYEVEVVSAPSGVTHITFDRKTP